jgi:carbamate kinase
MGPKVDSIMQFVESGGQKAIITDIDNLAAALQDEAGTIITADG